MSKSFLVTAAAAAILGSAAALPSPPIALEEILKGGLDAVSNQGFAFEKVLPVQPGFQWDDAGGYCGSWATQRAALNVGAWFSQQQVRDHTSPGGGHDNEILSTNIVEAYNNLKLDFEAFDYKNTPRPQQKAYASWLKKQLIAGNSVAWMIMWSGQQYPIYGLKAPAGMYGHVEPVIGIQSNHPLNDTTVYDDDTVVHLTDAGTSTVHRKLSTLGGKLGNGGGAQCGWYSYCMCDWAFGWAVTGFADDTKGTVPASLQVQPFLREPDLRSGQKPEQLKGTLTASGLEPGSSYDVYRWGSSETAFTYNATFKKTSFKATDETYVYEDPDAFSSGSATYYRVVAQ